MTKVGLLALKNQKAFDFKSKEAVRYSCRFFTFLSAKISSEENIIARKNAALVENPIFYGFKISKKYGNSVKRNLLKRRLKNIYLKFFQQNYSKISIIFIPKHQIKELEYKDLENEVFRAFNWIMKRL